MQHKLYFPRYPWEHFVTKGFKWNWLASTGFCGSLSNTYMYHRGLHGAESILEDILN